MQQPSFLGCCICDEIYGTVQVTTKRSGCLGVSHHILFYTIDFSIFSRAHAVSFFKQLGKMS